MNEERMTAFLTKKRTVPGRDVYTHCIPLLFLCSFFLLQFTFGICLKGEHAHTQSRRPQLSSLKVKFKKVNFKHVVTFGL
jgi:hypothetical protein